MQQIARYVFTCTLTHIHICTRFFMMLDVVCFEELGSCCKASNTSITNNHRARPQCCPVDKGCTTDCSYVLNPSVQYEQDYLKNITCDNCYCTPKSKFDHSHVVSSCLHCWPDRQSRCLQSHWGFDTHFHLLYQLDGRWLADLSHRQIQDFHKSKMKKKKDENMNREIS